RYGSILGGEWPRAPADVLVLAGRINDPQDRLRREYRLIRQYAIYVSPEFILGEPTWAGAVGQFRRLSVRVYTRGVAALHRVDVIASGRLQCHLHLGLPERRPREGAVVEDVEHVGPHLRHQRGEARELARSAE